MIDARLTQKISTNHCSVINITDEITCGDKELFVVAGPCAVESLKQMQAVVNALPLGTINGLRGCIYKPRTSPYSFQGLADQGLNILAEVKQMSKLPIVTEIMSVEQLKEAVEYVDVVQIGSRNMQNFELLKAVGQVGKPVLLKRGLSATIEEFVMAAEYVVNHGNPNVILCERGIRSFDSYTRNVLDLGAVVALRQLIHLPVVVDPSHAVGKRELVGDLAKAAIACGADGLIIECHPEPEKSVSDARQALSLPDMRKLIDDLRVIAAAVGRQLPSMPENVHPAELTIMHPELAVVNY